MSYKNLTLVLVVLLLATLLSAATIKPETDWWKRAVFYHIYPKSFKDSDSEGNLRGIINKLDYLVDRGFTSILLSPIYKSPHEVDTGYDVSDYKDIDPTFGTLEDFEELVEEAHEDRNLKIVLDFVPTHTSHQHEWFQMSENLEDGYEDYYVWSNASEDGSFPNNWASVVEERAWTWSEQREQYYLHQFSERQPDLNHKNPKVIEEIKDIVTFWLQKGVDGFRIIPPVQMFEDEPFHTEPTFELEHAYQHQPETYDLMDKFQEWVDEFVDENGGDAKVVITDEYIDIVHIYDKNLTFSGHETFLGKIVDSSDDEISTSEMSPAGDYTTVTPPDTDEDEENTTDIPSTGDDVTTKNPVETYETVPLEDVSDNEAAHTHVTDTLLDGGVVTEITTILSSTTSIEDDDDLGNNSEVEDDDQEDEEDFPVVENIPDPVSHQTEAVTKRTPTTTEKIPNSLPSTTADAGIVHVYEYLLTICCLTCMCLW